MAEVPVSQSMGTGPTTEANPTAPVALGLPPEMTDKIVEQLRKDMKEVIEKAVWKLVPELATQIIRDEIQRLLGDQK